MANALKYPVSAMETPEFSETNTNQGTLNNPAQGRRLKFWKQSKTQGIFIYKFLNKNAHILSVCKR